MNQWRCRECGQIFNVRDDDDLFFAVFDHSCEPKLSRLAMFVRWMRGRLTIGRTG